MEFTDGLTKEDFEIELRGMLKLMTFESKLPYIVFFDFENRIKRENKIPRIFISINSVYKRIVPVSIDRINPEILIDKEIPKFEIIKDWIIKNYNILIKYWKQEINGYQLFSELVIKKKNKHWEQYETDFDNLTLVFNERRDFIVEGEIPFDNLIEEEVADLIGLWKKHTNLSYEVLLDSLGKFRFRLNNIPRVLISLEDNIYNGNLVSISIDKYNPEILKGKYFPDFERVKDWIKLNYLALINHWNGNLKDCDIFDFLIKL